MKILTFNLRHNNDHWELRKPIVINLIEQHQPDIIGFQEVWMPIRQADIILEKITGQPYKIYSSPKQAHHGTEGIAIATRYPVNEFKTLDLPGGERVAQYVTFNHQGRDVCFANTHLHHQPFYSETERLPQMQALLNWLTPLHQPIILTGDMNCIPQSETIQLAKQTFESAYEQVHGREPAYTFPAPLAEEGYEREPVMIDYIFVSPDSLQATSAYVVGAEAHGANPTLSASDHLGVLAHLAFRG